MCVYVCVCMCVYVYLVSSPLLLSFVLPLIVRVRYIWWSVSLHVCFHNCDCDRHTSSAITYQALCVVYAYVCLLRPLCISGYYRVVKTHEALISLKTHEALISFASSHNCRCVCMHVHALHFGQTRCRVPVLQQQFSCNESETDITRRKRQCALGVSAFPPPLFSHRFPDCASPKKGKNWISGKDTFQDFQEG